MYAGQHNKPALNVTDGGEASLKNLSPQKKKSKYCCIQL
jgi:hypothetical protein